MAFTATSSTSRRPPGNKSDCRRKCLSFFGSCLKKPDKPASSTQQLQTPEVTTNADPNPTGLITMTYPERNLNKSSYPLRPIPERRSSRYHSAIQRNNMHSNQHHPRQRQRPRGPHNNHRHSRPLPLIEEEKHETTVGNPSEKEFAAEKIAVRDFGVEAAARVKRKKLREEGWETPGFEFEVDGEPESSGQGSGKGKGKEVVRKPVMEVEVEDSKGKEKEVAREDGTGEA